jgi:hypothetical protein
MQREMLANRKSRINIESRFIMKNNDHRFRKFHKNDFVDFVKFVKSVAQKAFRYSATCSHDSLGIRTETISNR